MDTALKAFIEGRAVAWMREQQETEHIVAVIDENEPADIYGENVLAWYVELLCDKQSEPVGVEVAIDPDGCVSVNELGDNVPHLQQLWPDPLPWTVEAEATASGQHNHQ